jgi:hypothetical protein
MAKRDEFSPRPDVKKGIYRHYKKGDEYEVLNVACHSETHEWYVVYKRLYEHDVLPEVWIRPAHMFFEVVTWEGKSTPRFTHIRDEE